MSRISVSTHRATAVTEWEITSVPVPPKGGGGIDDPSQLGERAWVPAQVPGTAASALRAAGQWDFGAKRNFDADEWWLRGRFDAEPAGNGETLVLRFGGLATLADVWLNGEHVLASDNMFVAHDVDVTGRVKAKNEIAIRFKSLTAALGARRPRPRWRTRLVDQQQLRWFRTTLLGRIPGWTPPVACVGAWRGVTLERRTVHVDEAKAQARVDGKDGIVRISLRAPGVTRATARVGDAQSSLQIRNDGQIEGEIRVENAKLWWPHTHGAPALYPVSVTLRTAQGDVSVDLGRVGFRTIALDTSNDGFTVRVNGVDVFCRGACWTTADIVSLRATPAEYMHIVGQARAAGMNMLRVGGTMTYEDDAFYDACDELGILVWQDFMFANMDYPASDEAFLASVKREATQFLERVAARPSLAILCGNSEVEQQVAMLGLPREQWTQALFTEVLPSVGRALRPDVPYVASTPTGGSLPFQVSAGISHYYGVGAYMRPLEDARRAEVRFTSECLGFSNIPEDTTVEAVVADGESPFHHPAWKARVPRDSGPGWDFEDVRDHYLQRLFGVEPARLRYADMGRYLALSRVVTGEVMASAIAEWRRPKSSCKGALIWFYRDLWPGAGWGVIDALGLPKAAYYYAKRAMASTALFVSDEGLNGLELHAINDSPDAIGGEVRFALYRNGDVKVAEGRAAVHVPAQGSLTLRGDAMLEHFLDTTYAYRFGPPAHDFTVATWTDARGARVGEWVHFAHGWPATQRDDLGLEAAAEALEGGAFAITLRTQKFAQSVAFDARGFVPDDDYVHIAPGAEMHTVLRPLKPGTTPKLQATVQALNATSPVKVALKA